MTAWQDVLREQDPIEPLTADESAAIRRAVVVEARAAEASTAPVPRLAPMFALGGALMAAVVAGVFVARAQPTSLRSGPSASGSVTEIQFATPGGTRVIWQFNKDFAIQGAHP